MNIIYKSNALYAKLKSISNEYDDISVTITKQELFDASYDIPADDQRELYTLYHKYLSNYSGNVTVYNITYTTAREQYLDIFPDFDAQFALKDNRAFRLSVINAQNPVKKIDTWKLVKIHAKIMALQYIPFTDIHDITGISYTTYLKIIAEIQSENPDFIFIKKHKLSDNDIIDIKRGYNNGTKAKYLAVKYNVNLSTIYNAIKNHTITNTQLQ